MDRQSGHRERTLQAACIATCWPAFAGMTRALRGCGADAALAHTGLEHAVSFAAGFKHPWTGLDHMLAMVAVGLWAGLNGGRALWAWPVAFVGVMVAGGALGFADVPLPMVEPGILASVVVLGLLVLAAAQLAGRARARRSLPSSPCCTATRTAPSCRRRPPPSTYAAGFALATALLHALGLGVAYLAASDGGRMLVRGAGALVAVAGVALAVV